MSACFVNAFSPKTMADAPGPHGLWWSGGVVRCTGYQWERRIRRPKGWTKHTFFSWHGGGREMMLFWKIWMVKFHEQMPVKEVKMQSISLDSLAYKKAKWIWDPVLMSARCALQTAGFIFNFPLRVVSGCLARGFLAGKSSVGFPARSIVVADMPESHFLRRNPIKYAVSIARWRTYMTHHDPTPNPDNHEGSRSSAMAWGRLRCRIARWRSNACSAWAAMSGHWKNFC